MGSESEIAQATETSNENEGGGGGVTVNNGNDNNSAAAGIPVDDEYYNYALGPTIAALKHNPGITLNWSPQEFFLMQELLVKHASVPNATKYAIVAQHLNEKTALDVSLFVNWIKKNIYKCQGKDQFNSHIAEKKESRKRRKDDDNPSRKNKDKVEKVADPSAKSISYLTNQSDGSLYAQTAVSMDSDDGISCKDIDGANGQLLKQNAQVMDQISANLRAFKIHDNINLFCQARNNIETLLNDLDQLELMGRMPPFPVKLDENLTSNLLPPAFLLKNS
ncbi:DUF3755 domain-containing protein [Heracleum sosnowskyi]|uniref:DUF3755 domain-containing protein n=1 Tax=Heracleum sosnowskyi TaxID=360622 RepID=A0AAD8GT27_9APIA|nr:DUF3755 domain-containing protein [Heracleum sosnowskyi]